MNLGDGEVQPLYGVMVSPEVAADLIAALDRLAALITPRGGLLSPRLIAIRERFTRAITRVDASAEVAAAQDVLVFERDAITDTTTAAQVLGISEDGVRWLCRTGRLDADRMGRQWAIGIASLEEHKTRRAG